MFLRYFPFVCFERLKRSTDTSVTVVSSPAGIRTWYFSNTSLGLQISNSHSAVDEDSSIAEYDTASFVNSYRCFRGAVCFHLQS
jgi:hypothetical protein